MAEWQLSKDPSITWSSERYLLAGDCLEAGYDPPQSVVVLLDSELAEMEHTSTPSVRMPRAFELVWKDEGDRADRCLSIWRPVPFPGCAFPLACLITLKVWPENVIQKSLSKRFVWHGCACRTCRTVHSHPSEQGALPK